MAHTFDASTVFPSGITFAGPPTSVNFTCGAGSTLLVVGVTCPSVAGKWVTTTAPTYDSVALTRINRLVAPSASPEVAVELWYLRNPPTGSSLSVSLTGRDASTMLRVSSWKAGTDKTSIYDVSALAAGSGTTSTASVTTTKDGDVCIQITANNRAAVFSAYTHTPMLPVDHGAFISGMQYLAPQTAAGALTMTMTALTAEWGTIIGAFKETYASGKISKIAGLAIASVSKISTCASTAASAVAALGCFGGVI